jgi:hypothetical protein
MTAIRLVEEIKPTTGEALYSIEKKLPGGAWCYVATTVCLEKEKAAAMFERLKANGLERKTVLMEGDAP